MGEKIMKKRRPFDLFENKIVLILWFILFPSAVVVLIWGLIYTSRRNKPDLEQCKARETKCGFKGNPDIYGLGIRLGTYMQWLAGILANLFIPKERRGIASAITGFLFALEIALVVLIFKPHCTYVVEIIIIFFLIYGGLAFTLYEVGMGSSGTDTPLSSSASSVSSISSISSPSEGGASSLQAPPGILTASIPLVIGIPIISAWFWLRLAQNQLTPFVDTPCGLSFFMFAHITGKAVRPASILIASLNLLVDYIFVIGMARAALEGSGRYFLADIVFKAGVLPAVGVIAFVIIIPILAVGLGAVIVVGVPWFIYLCIMMCIKAMVAEASYATVTTFLPDPEKFPQQIESWQKLFQKYALFPAILFGALAVTIIAIELTIVWNNISEVNNLETTGQLIPFILGVIGLLIILWKLYTEHETKLYEALIADRDSLEGYVVSRQKSGDSRWLLAGTVAGTGTGNDLNDLRDADSAISLERPVTIDRQPQRRSSTENV